MDVWVSTSWAEPNLRGERGKVGNHAYTRICSNCRKIAVQSDCRIQVAQVAVNRELSEKRESAGW